MLLEMVDLEVLLSETNKYSHKIYTVSCDYHISDKCRKIYSMEFRQYVKLTTNNNGKLPCIFCSRTLKFSNRNNPNTKYKSLNDHFFNKIDTVEKAYLLGWIASDGHIGKRGFKIAIHQKDIKILEFLRDNICKEIPIRKFKTKTSKLCSFEINSQQISKDLCQWLNIKPGKKSDIVSFPKLNNFCLDFIRGYFDGDGSINDPDNSKYNFPKGNIRSNSPKLLEGIKKYCNITSNITCNMLCLSNNKMINFLDQLYLNNGPKLERKYKRYLKWKNK